MAKKSKIKGPSNEQDPTIQDEPREPEAGAAIAGGVAGSARDEFGRAQEANAADWWHLPTRNGAEKEALIRLREARPDIATAPDAGKQVGEGTEHLVEHGPEGTVTKHTKNFGYVLHPTVGPFGGYAELREATPSEYLDRLDETNQRFGVESKVIGLTRTGDHVGFAVSQPAIKGTEPTLPEVEAYMRAGGYEKVNPDLLEGTHIKDKTWYHGRDHVVVTDVKPDNFKKDEKGRVVPIDLIAQHAIEGSDLRKVFEAPRR